MYHAGCTMSRQRIEHTATTTADPATVYALLRDGATWPVWGPLDSFELEGTGEQEPEGLGAVRLFRSGRVTGRDTIAELVQDRRFSYTHVSNLPIKNYRADVDLDAGRRRHGDPVGVGLRPEAPGDRRLLRRGLDGFVSKLVNGLAEHASSRARVAG